MFSVSVLQLEAFLSQRLLESHSEGNILASSQFQNAPASVQIDEKVIETMATEVKKIITQLTSVQIQHLMLIRNSPRYEADDKCYYFFTWIIFLF